jgi:hypothetical protein
VLLGLFEPLFLCHVVAIFDAAAGPICLRSCLGEPLRFRNLAEGGGLRSAAMVIAETPDHYTMEGKKTAPLGGRLSCWWWRWRESNSAYSRGYGATKRSLFFPCPAPCPFRCPASLPCGLALPAAAADNQSCPTTPLTTVSRSWPADASGENSLQGALALFAFGFSGLLPRAAICRMARSQLTGNQWPLSAAANFRKGSDADPGGHVGPLHEHSINACCHRRSVAWRGSKNLSAPASRGPPANDARIAYAALKA